MITTQMRFMFLYYSDLSSNSLKTLPEFLNNLQYIETM